MLEHPVNARKLIADHIKTEHRPRIRAIEMCRPDELCSEWVSCPASGRPLVADNMVV